MIGGFGRMGVGFGKLGASSPRKRAIESLSNATAIASITLGGLIIPERQTSEGVLIRSYAAAWIEIAQQLSEDWSLAFQLNSRQWEEMLAGAMSADGYEVTLTPRSGDHGRDVIAVKHGIGTIRILGSMKAYAPDHLVGRDHVDEMLGVLFREANASKGIIATTSDFAPRLFEAPNMNLVIPSRLELMNGVKLQKWLTDLSD
ncbi:restriction endonuclease [Bradyrhizobium manausense]|uniref:restriction endonuclease n=1 Tax=Bradyrhizobium TaxID=374 RepID=UPI001BA9C875|nr:MULTISPECIES: restriction endonuclease [Bradyrhizobium]MBR0828996.1 restriction endonuclease [Bradyrhizobium manausense]UVO27999.1 restriction endonuclease [Bradyrhizobium arachidis]